MRKKYHFIILLIICLQSYCFSQTDNEGPKPNFGIPLTDVIELPSKYNFIVDIKLEKLKKSKARAYYASNNEELFSKDFMQVNNSKVSWNQIVEKKKCTVLIPPLKPNQFYRLNIEYVSAESLTAMLFMLHDEGIDNWHSQKKEWMKLLDRLSFKAEPVSITYDPTKNDLLRFKFHIKDLDFNLFKKKIDEKIDSTGLNKDELKQKKDELKKKKANLKEKQEELFSKMKSILSENFEILKFNDLINKIERDAIIEFSTKVQRTSADNLDEDSTTWFSSILYDIPDYVNIYKFYEKYLREPFTNKSLSGINLLKYIEESVNNEKSEFEGEELVPSHLDGILTSINNDFKNKTKKFNTFPDSFKNSFKLSLVPDFGYVGYLVSSSSSPSGGDLFLGVNVSLSPSNKDVPLQISSLTLLQRLAIHTGVTIGSISEANVRDNFFGNYSLLLGGSYKVFTQGTRVNFGGLFYNKIDAINGSKSIAIQPYIGLSIDLEIKKWLQTIFPNIKL